MNGELIKEDTWNPYVKHRCVANIRQYASNGGKDSSETDDGVQGCTGMPRNQLAVHVNSMKITDQPPSEEVPWQ